MMLWLELDLDLDPVGSSSFSFKLIVDVVGVVDDDTETVFVSVS